jgi:hypothetical protein
MGDLSPRLIPAGSPGKCFFSMPLRSEPEPLTRSMRVSRPRKSLSARLIDVLPPPQTTSDVSAPISYATSR